MDVERVPNPGQVGGCAGLPRAAGVTSEEILRVAAFRDRAPEREAAIIALVYHRLACDLAVHLGPEVNWYGFATWSSKAVGASLDLGPTSPLLLETGSRLRVPRRFQRQFRAVALVTLGPSYQLALALANRAIFLETASLAAGLRFGPSAASAAPSFLYRIADPPVPSNSQEPDAEERPMFLSDLLGDADDHYLDLATTLMTDAAGTDDPGRRRELLLGANVALSAFEQARAQRLLELAMYRPCRWLMRVSWRWALSAITRRPFHRFGLYTRPHEQMSWTVRHAESLWSRFYTRFIMVLPTPVSRIRLGKSLRPPPGAAVHPFPPIEDARVRKLIESFQPQPEHALDGVHDWLDYRARMRFITSYFRSYLSMPEMLGPPFAPTLLEELGKEVALGAVPDPVYCEWFHKQQQDFEARASRPGMRGWVLRKFYRPPIECDPDAAELAQIELSDYLVERIVNRQVRDE
ncbi:hypothetical protein [Actinomadura fibrosa]|uniref:Uncharacterized protein n=1 Tax=Actinomadura fibrosa TaxID=111802 RepID=A0ABW2XZ86_9ACTN|nr:hypothetical protein [Actinomadura fibrosa]